MNFTTYQKYLVAAVPLLIIGALIYYFTDIVTYIVLAWVLSMIGAPLNSFLGKYLNKSIASIITLMTFAFVLVVLLSLFIPPVVQQAREFTSVGYDQLVVGLEEPLDDWNNWLIENGILENGIMKDSIDNEEEVTPPKDEFQIVAIDSILKSRGDPERTGVTLLIDLHHPDELHPETETNTEVLASDSFFDRVKKNLFQFLDPSRIPEIFGSIVGFFGNILIAILSILFIAFFFLKQQGLFVNMIRALVPNEFEDQTAHAIDESARLLMRYFIGVCVQITIITIFISSVLGFLKFENALLIGFFAALMNVIPYIGPILGASFGIIITISSNIIRLSSNVDPAISFYSDLLPQLGILVVVFAIMQLMDNLILQPNIFSKSVKAHPLEIFIIILMGAKLGGVLGMVLAIPIYTVLRVLAKVFLSEFKIVQKITQSI